MKDAAPRIFRGLQSPGGRAGFDAIVSAAVAAYGSLRAPSEAQSVEFGRLVVPLWPRTAVETQRALAASLSHSTRMPPLLVDLVVDAPLEVSAPFLVSSPVLTPLQVDRLAARGDRRVGRILDARVAAGLDRIRPARRVVDAPPLSPEHLAAPDTRAALDAAAFVRDTLRRIAQADRSENDAVGPLLLRAARLGEPTTFFDVLQARLGLEPAERDGAESDAGGHRLALVLKEAGLATGEALAILMLVCPRIGLNVRAFEDMAAHYRSLGVERRRELRPVQEGIGSRARAEAARKTTGR